VKVRVRWSVPSWMVCRVGCDECVVSEGPEEPVRGRLESDESV